MKKVIYMHSGSGNHGCEALLRTTSKLLGGPKDTILWSHAKKEDIFYGADEYVAQIVESEEIKKYSLSYFKALVKRKIFKQNDANMNVFLENTFKDSVAVSIGGDIYCYPWSAQQSVDLNKKIRKYCKKNVLWGCSIDKEALTEEVKQDLAGYDLITAREQVTYELLKDINPNTVQVADSAFLLGTETTDLPACFSNSDVVGINVSPLIMKYVDDDNLVLKNYERLIEFILNTTSMNVCLIPHVVWENNDDRKSCEYLYEKFNKNSRISIVNDMNCKKLKYIISKCRFFIGARTHSTIAAYSTFVPTLVVGYSVKSIGIAMDIFNTDKNHVIPVQRLSNEDDLLNSFSWIMDHELEEKEILERIIPKYKQNARKGLEYLSKLK